MTKFWNGPIGPVTLTNVQGEMWTFATLAEAIRVAWRDHVDFAERLQPVLFGSGPWYGLVICRDECGMVVPLWRIEAERQRLGPDAFPVRRHGKPRIPAYDHERDFRKGPVPGRHRCHWRGYYRHIRTHAELRDHFGLEADLQDLEDFPVRVKIRRRRINLPTAWDDIPRSRRGDGWKAYRKTRFK